MSSVVDVGDTFELTYTAPTGSSVEVSWLDQDQVEHLSLEPVPESPPGSGLFPYLLTATLPGMWTARFTRAGDVEQYYVRARAVGGRPPLASIGDVVSQFGPLTTAQEGLTSYLLRGASAIVRGPAGVPQVDAWIASGRLSSDMVALAVSAMVLRVLRNPKGLRSETVGPFSRTYDISVAAGLLVLTEAERDLLVPAPPEGTGSSFAGATIRLGAGMLPPPGWRERQGRWPYGRY